MGGDCLNTGCVPSKALLAAAHAAQPRARPAARRAAGRAADRLAGGARARPRRDRRDRAHRFRGPLSRRSAPPCCAATRGSSAPDTLAVGGRRLTARRIVIAAGSRAAVPDIPGLAALAVPHQRDAVRRSRNGPAHLLILGGGADRAGDGAGPCRRSAAASRSSRPHASPRKEDAGTGRRALRAVLAAQGVDLHRGREVVDRCEPGPALVLADGRRVAGTHLLVATGRRPNLDGLGSRRAAWPRPRRGSRPMPGCAVRRNRRVYAAGDIADPEGIGPRALHPCRPLSRRHRDPPRAVPPAGAHRLPRPAARHLHRPRAGAGRL